MTTVGMIGQGRMGAGMTERLRAAGIEVVAFDRDPSRSDVADLGALVNGLVPPRLVWLMVPAGDPTAETIDGLVPLLSAGDTVVDGGNQHWRETVARSGQLASHGIDLVDVGVSGGIWGREHGYALMIGGPEGAVARLAPVLEALRPVDGGLVHAGAAGAGHFAKMIHNGIEYGMMQSLAEGVELLSSGGPEDLDVTAVLRGWQHGTVIRSWLLDLLLLALEDDEELARLRGHVQDSGEGRWTVEHAVATATPAPAITAALYARFASRQEDPLAMRVLAALRREFGGHEARS
jgi:6-phosphogluconate dehydrogenase